MFKIDEGFKNLIPPLSTDERNQLEENCKEFGIRDTLVVGVFPGSDGAVLLDGHNRFEIAQKCNLSYEEKRLDFESREAAEEWIIKNQLGRRNIPAYVRAELALKLKPVIAEKARERMLNPMQNSAQGTTRDELAKTAGVSHDTIHKVEVIQKEASEEVKNALRSGDMSINSVYGSIVASKIENRQKEKARELREAKERNEEFEEKRAEGVIDLSEAKQNKDDREKIFESFLNSFNDMNDQIRHFGMMAENGDFVKLLSYGDKYDIRDILTKLGNELRTLMKLQRLATEVNDEK